MVNQWSRPACALLVVVALCSHANADEIEQTPNVAYKIATADVVEPGYPVTAPAAPSAAASDGSLDPSGSAEPSGPSLPPPTVVSGPRLEGAGVLAFPVGDIGPFASISFSPDLRIGYEALFGNFGIEGGGMARFTYWRLEDDGDTLWTMETMAYGRVALHVSRVAFHAGVALGLDTNYIYSSMLDKSKTTVGFGMNIQSGIDIAATPELAFKFGFDYHPGTDRISDTSDATVSYFALLLGVGLRM
jgi:hypothetical protein